MLTLALPAIVARGAADCVRRRRARSASRMRCSASPARSIFLEALMLWYDKVPFTCTYVPGRRHEGVVPIYGWRS